MLRVGSKGSEILILCVKGLDILYRCFMAFVMVRFPRLNLPRIYQHVVQRGNNRQASYFAENINNFDHLTPSIGAYRAQYCYNSDIILIN